MCWENVSVMLLKHEMFLFSKMRIFVPVFVCKYEWVCLWVSEKESVKTFTTAMCAKDCGINNQNIDILILIACLVAWLDSSPVEIKKN